MDVVIRDAQLADAAEMVDIYNYYVLNTIVTFEEKPVSVDEFRTRMNSIRLSNQPWLVAECDETIVGYAYACPWKTRSAYRFTVESTVYLTQQFIGKGIGTMLYRALFDKLKLSDVHAVIGGIALPNAGSVALQEKFGFKKVAHFEQVGYKFNQWIDVGYWELVLPD
jgi:L-amino acid N-acyltransferase YncA